VPLFFHALLPYLRGAMDCTLQRHPVCCPAGNAEDATESALAPPAREQHYDQETMETSIMSKLAGDRI
jgi:hypothetical protein